MFEQLYTSPVAVARHRSGPLLQERLAYLTHLRDEGYMTNALRRRARNLLVIARLLGMASRPRTTVTLNEVKRKTIKHPDPDLYGLAVRWLKFTGRLQQRPTPLSPCEKKIKAFADYMEHEAELSPQTISSRCWYVRRFLRSAACQKGFAPRDHSSSDRHGVSEDARTGRLFAGDDPNLRYRTAGFLPFCGSAGLVP